MSTRPNESVKNIQQAFDELIEISGVSTNAHTQASNKLASLLLTHFDNHQIQEPAQELFSKHTPPEIKRFAASWLLRALVEADTALSVGNLDRQAIALFDSVYANTIYRRLGITTNFQTYDKRARLIEFAADILNQANQLVNTALETKRIPNLQQQLLKLFNDHNCRAFLSPLLPEALTNVNMVRSLFDAVSDYMDAEFDHERTLEQARTACDEYERQAIAHGSQDSIRILGGLARQLKQTVETHFKYLEFQDPPRLSFAEVKKMYPMDQLGNTITFYLKVTNSGKLPVRDLRLEEIAIDPQLKLTTRPMPWGTVRPGTTVTFDIGATVIQQCKQSTLLLLLSWDKPGVGRAEEELEFTLEAQRADFDWEQLEIKDPYSLDPITSDVELIGRKKELNSLRRITNSKSVGSAVIFGQKRVGKTSLVNSLAYSLENDKIQEWTVINIGTGDFIGNDALSTMAGLGKTLFTELTNKVPNPSGLNSPSIPDFSNGLSPLSQVIDELLSWSNTRLLFVIDEFDELQVELLSRTDLSKALFQPIRQISNKARCGFLLVGGENMQHLETVQGDRLNKFDSIQVDYFQKDNMVDFAKLIRKPVSTWLTISESAIDELYHWSAGNPYFAKYLARQLFREMVDQRCSDVSEVDMRTAILTAAAAVRGNSFAHFWIDGVTGDVDNVDKLRLDTRSVLIAAAQAFRDGVHVTEESVLKKLATTSVLSLGEHSSKKILSDLIRREVFVAEDSYLKCKVPLFEYWLKDQGVRVLLDDLKEHEFRIATMRDEELSRVTDEDLIRTCKKLGRFRGRSIESATIRSWLDQFGDVKNQRLMFKILNAVKMYDNDRSRGKMNEAFGIVSRTLTVRVGSRSRRLSRSGVAVSHFGTSLGKSGSRYCQLFAEENRIADNWVVSFDAVKQALEPGSKQLQGMQKLVFVDDFIGTGQSIVDCLGDAKETLCLASKQGVEIFVIVVAGFSRGKKLITQYAEKHGIDIHVHCCDIIDGEGRVFSAESKVFVDSSEREDAKRVAELFGVRLEKQWPLGYGNLEGIVVFEDNCPNNSLPILWSQSNGWVAPFPRS
ncbi:MAG: ATP-binding protein [Caldilineaceae bacterium SB0661_bin_34]|nr:ATP-binding protein [Caldilineaceae bacterium SB0661_bin_34]